MKWLALLTPAVMLLVLYALQRLEGWMGDTPRPRTVPAVGRVAAARARRPTPTTRPSAQTPLLREGT